MRAAQALSAYHGDEPWQPPDDDAGRFDPGTMGNIDDDPGSEWDMARRRGAANGSANDHPIDDELIASLEEMTPVELEDWAPLDLNIAGAERPKPPVIRGTIYASTKHLVFGPFSSSKTMYAAWCAVEVILKAQTVVWLDVDGGHPGDLRERLLSFGLTPQQIQTPHDGGHLIYLRPESKLGTQRAEAIAQQCRDHDVRLVVVDSAIGSFSMEGKDPDKAQDVNAWWSEVGEALQGHIAGILLIAHSGLAADAQTRAAHSQRFGTLPAVVYQLKTSDALRRAEPRRDVTGTSSIIVRKDRPSYHRVPRATSMGTFRVTSHCVRDTAYDDDGEVIDDGEWTLAADLLPPAKDDAAASGWRPTTLMERGSRKAEEAHEPLTKTALKSLIGGKSENAGKAIEYLIIDGYLRDTNPGQRGSKLAVIRPYRAPADDHPNTPRGDLYGDDE